MNLKKASILLVIGLLYTCIYKLIKGLFPIIIKIEILNTALSVLWILSALTIIVFIVFFLREIKSQVLSIRLPLNLIIIFTSIIIILKLPLGIIPNEGITRKLIFNLSVLLNSISILYFLVSFYRLNSDVSLKSSIKLMIWGFILESSLDIISFGGYLYFIITKTEIYVLSKFQAIAIIIFAFTYYSILNFLIRFIKIENYSTILKT